MSLVDTYTLRARVQPALIVVLPAGFLMFALLPEHPFFVTAFFGLLGAAGGTAIVAQVGRDPGRKKEKALWDRWGGPPTTRFLRHHRTTGDRYYVSDELRKRIEGLIKRPLPSVEEEKADPEGTDRRYREATEFLREATRDTSKFPLVLAENANYGFRRNLWGIKKHGMVAAGICALLSSGLALLSLLDCTLAKPWWLGIANVDSSVVIRLVVATADAAFVAFWLFWVKRAWIKTAADAYAECLLASAWTVRIN